MEPTADRRPGELPVVTALRSLSVFSPDQAGAYREHFSELAAALGDDVKTKLATFLTDWVSSGQPGMVVLTGNAGTGKTAAAEAYCRALGVSLPDRDVLVQVSTSRWVLKDLWPAGPRVPGSSDARCAGLSRLSGPGMRKRGRDARRPGRSEVCAQRLTP